MFRIWRAAMGSPSLYALGGWTVRKFAALALRPGIGRKRSSTQCGCGTVIARPCVASNRSEQNGEKTVPQAQAEAQTKETPSENSSRDRILQQIRAGLRTVVPEPPALASDRVIFEPVANPLERFQQECVLNLMECAPDRDRLPALDSYRRFSSLCPKERFSCKTIRRCAS